MQLDSKCWRAIQERKNAANDNSVMRDIMDGAEYQVHLPFTSSCPANLTLTCNTDGVSIYRSSKTSIWPIWLTINELPPSMRFA